jgi:threonine/homoserine/homoserine lactone efflux protein
MTSASLIAFVLAASLIVITPGLDTALVLRTAASGGARRALMAGAGIACGCLCWGTIVAVGLGALLAASEFAYTALRWAGATYLFYLGARLIASPRRSLGATAQAGTLAPARNDASWLLRGLLTNLLNPKVGVFYVSFLPQFIPFGSDVAVSTVLLAAIHALLGMLWFVVIVAATRPLARLLEGQGVIAWLDRVTGGLFVAFGLRLAMARSN